MKRKGGKTQPAHSFVGAFLRAAKGLAYFCGIHEPKRIRYFNLV